MIWVGIIISQSYISKVPKNSCSDRQTSGPIDRTPETPGPGKNNNKKHMISKTKKQKRTISNSHHSFQNLCRRQQFLGHLRSSDLTLRSILSKCWSSLRSSVIKTSSEAKKGVFNLFHGFHGIDDLLKSLHRSKDGLTISMTSTHRQIFIYITPLFKVELGPLKPHLPGNYP